ncbi:MAG: cytochrome [Alphaproteobacteria bacterium PA4]|nr:MAG: cytochrome [Alphaproteobacteria bacterium PA4]
MHDDMIPDPFADARRRDGVLVTHFGNEAIPMILSHRAVRAAAGNWQVFSSDAPFRVPIPSEEQVRSIRQLPIEADPPLHSRFRALLNPIFRRPLQADYAARIDALVAGMIEAAAARPSVEIVRDFALPLQSRALTLLLGMPEAAAEEWIGWGTHVFHDGADGTAKGAVLDTYIRHRVAAAHRYAGEDFFGAMTRMQVDGRALTDDEMVGIANLVFAGGRDTVINAISRIIGHFAADRAALVALGSDSKRIAFAVEEFIRVISPLTHIGRVCPAETTVGPVTVAADARVSLCWAAANHDEQVFDDPATLRLDRSPNPHVGFGSGIHNCLGSAQARVILRSLIRQLGARTRAMTLLAAEKQFETTPQYRRWVGYESLHIRIEGASA